MKKRLLAASVPVTLLTTLLMTAGSPVLAADNLADAIKETKFQYQLRWRWENVDQDPFPHSSNAIPLRARINFHTADLYGFSLKTEFDYVFNFGLDKFNAGAGNTPRPRGYPVIADPGGEDLNQLFLQYKADFGQFRAGRQRVIYDNARFLGNVGWRQNEQTYDSFTFAQSAGADFDFKYTYINKVRTIFGNDVPAGKRKQNDHMGNLSYKFENNSKITAYYYYIKDKDRAVFSTSTWGFRYTGTTTDDGPKLGYTLEYANQSDAANNPVDYSADYWRVDLSLVMDWATPYIGYEVLAGDNDALGKSFRTPLATLHAFNGWADKFLITPNAGLTDAFIGIKGKLSAWKWNVLYHNFKAESGSNKFGYEIDGSIGRKFADHYGILFKAAYFSGHKDANPIIYGDTTKLWVQLTANF